MTTIVSTMQVILTQTRLKIQEIQAGKFSCWKTFNMSTFWKQIFIERLDTERHTSEAICW